MEITRKKIDTIEVFELNGKLDVVGSKIVQQEILPILAKDLKILIDMTGCSYVASSGLRVLLIIAKQSAMVSCTSALANVQPLVWDVITSTGFEEVLATYDSVENGLRELSNA